ncbi:MAG: restriction endonuclease subunit S [Treponema sp.]|nr:restriction endonuclease subunit S [Treponema sp.]
MCDYGKCKNAEPSELLPDSWILDLEDIEKNTGVIKKFINFSERNSLSTKHIFTKGTVLYSKLRPYLNKVVIAPKDGFCTSEILPLDFNGAYINIFAQRLLMSPYFLSTVNMLTYGVKMPRLGSGEANQILLPLPPLSEQKRIVSAIEKAFEQIDIIEKNKDNLKNYIKQTKNKVLDLAIHGKLVEQNPQEGNAADLLQKIREEKNSSHSELDSGVKKKSKTDKNASFIIKADDGKHYEQFPDGSLKDIEDEIPFEIPENWCWCRLPELCTIPITDGTHQTPTYSDKENGIPFLSSKDVTKQIIDWSKIKYITKELHQELYQRIAPQKDDVLLAKNGTTGVAALVEDDRVFDIYVTLAVLRPNKIILNPCYLLWTINSPVCKNQFNSHLLGIGVPNLHLYEINKTLLPLPPLAEQQRIVEKIEEIFGQLEILEKTIGE